MKWFASYVSAFFALFSFFCATALAQGVYVTRGESGPVFSDKPQAGAKELLLKPLNVVPPPRESSAEEKHSMEKKGSRGATDEWGGHQNQQGRAIPVYRSFAIVSPESSASVAGDSSVFEVRLAVDPPLLLGDGHAFVVRINGRFVEQRFTATEFMIPPDFWVDGYVPSNQSMQLDASVVDGVGQVVMRAAPVVFYTRQLTIAPGYNPGYPGYIPPPVRPGAPPHKPRRPERSLEVPRPAAAKKTE